MSSKNRSEQMAEGKLLRQRRRLNFMRFCNDIAKNNATVLFEEDGVIFAEREGIRWVLHRAIDPTTIWFETWQLLHSNSSALEVPGSN
jgi:hypothetical protein